MWLSYNHVHFCTHFFVSVNLTIKDICRKYSSSDLVQLPLRLQQLLALGPPAPLPLLLLQLELLPLTLQLCALSLDAFTANFTLQVTVTSQFENR